MSNKNKKVGKWRRYEPKRRLLRYLITLIGAVLVVASWRILDIRYNFVDTLPRETRDVFSRMYPPDYTYSTEIINPLVETVHISILGTVLAIILSIPVAYIAASNTSPNLFTLFLGKLIVTVARSVNTIIVALILVAILGPGALAGVLAIGLRSVGFIGKLLAEEIEEIDRSQVEAIRAAGGSRFDMLLYGVVPQIKPAFITISTFRWDINVRGATILGFVGAGGIGLNLINQVNQFRWDAVATILIAILAVVIVSELTSVYLRKKAI